MMKNKTNGTTPRPPVWANLPPDSRPRSIGIRLAVITRQMRQRFDARVEAMGVTRAKFTLLAAVARQPGATQRTIANLLEVTDVTAGRLIDRVCADGMLERKESPLDRRAYCVDLTPAAEPLMKQISAIVDEFENEMFASFDEDDLKMLNVLLEKMSRNLNMSRDDHGAKRAASGAKQETASEMGTTFAV
jgi:MarR family transcriptional regulator for hemolysin